MSSRSRRPAGSGGLGMGPLRGALTALTLAAALGASASAVRSESVWDMEGIGRWLEGYDLAARGAGSTAIGVIDPYGMSPVNPAGAAWAKLPQADFAYLIENRWVSAPGQEGGNHRATSRLPGIRVVLPTRGPLSFALGYRDLTDGSYRTRFSRNDGREDAFTRTLRGSGGLGELSGTVALRPWRDRIALGAALGAAGGTLQDVTEDDYSSDVYVDTKNLLRTRMRNGRTWALGAQGRLAPGLTAGAVVQGGSHLDLKGLWTTTSGQLLEDRARMDLPTGTGLGLSYTIRKRNRLALDWSRQAWSESKFRGSGDGSDSASGFARLRDTQRIGVGITRLPGETAPKDPLLRRSIYRAGFSWGQLPVRQNNGVTVTEWVAAVGLGLPVQVDRGYLDGLLEIGRTGNLGKVGVRETFVRIGLGVTFGRFASRF